MQTLEASKLLIDLDRELLRERVRSLYAHRDAGDIERVVSLLAEDVVCFPRSTWGRSRYPTQIVGRDAAREMLRLRHVNYVVLLTTLNRILVDGDEACVHRTTTLRERGGGDSFTFDCVDFFRFREGLFVEISECHDGKAQDGGLNYPN